MIYNKIIYQQKKMVNITKFIVEETACRFRVSHKTKNKKKMSKLQAGLFLNEY